MNSHRSLVDEFSTYECVKSGDIMRLKEKMTPLSELDSSYGKLSSDSLRNVRYHFIIAVAMIARFCIDGGMDLNEAYSLSDYYILKGDEATSPDVIITLHKEAMFDYTRRMQKLSYKKTYSKAVLICFDYIYDNLHHKISLEEIASHVGLTPQYLSKFFHEQVGESILQYIINKKIEAAQNMLKYSNYTSQQISQKLAFSSHSYFITTFKKITGITPKDYQNKYFGKIAIAKEEQISKK